MTGPADNIGRKLSNEHFFYNAFDRVSVVCPGERVNLMKHAK
jgi:hypothetical protein